MVKLLTIAGLGPGASNMVTPNVQEAISSATDIVGYIPYVARIPPRDGLVYILRIIELRLRGPNWRWIWRPLVKKF